MPGSALLHIALFLLTTRDCEAKTCVQVHLVWKALRFRQPSHLILLDQGRSMRTDMAEDTAFFFSLRGGATASATVNAAADSPR